MKYLTILIILYFININAFSQTNDSMIDINVGLGLPNLINVNIATTRLNPVVFGIGLGTIPIDGLAKKYMKFDENEYKQVVDEYTILPDFSLSWKSFQTFFRYYLGDIFFIQALYAVWYIDGYVYVKATGGLLGTSKISLATAAFKLIQPMVGLNAGWKWSFGNLYFETSLGAVYFTDPKYSIGLYTAADAYKSLLPEDTASQMEEAKIMVQKQLDEGMNQYKSIVKVGPILAIALGIVI